MYKITIIATKWLFYTVECELIEQTLVFTNSIVRKKLESTSNFNEVTKIGHAKIEFFMKGHNDWAYITLIFFSFYFLR